MKSVWCVSLHGALDAMVRPGQGGGRLTLQERGVVVSRTAADSWTVVGMVVLM
jgi:hypothetical protein